jgi:hypothetical protein
MDQLVLHIDTTEFFAECNQSTNLEVLAIKSKNEPFSTFYIYVKVPFGSDGFMSAPSRIST